MAPPKVPTSPKNVSPKISATAKLGAEAKLLVENKKITTEVVPEDVSRAKASAWLDLVSPLTEWAGLKGDELKAKRNLLRVHQEVTLTEILIDARQRISKRGTLGQDVPLKFMVPFLERASIESDEKELKNLWSSLLASAFVDYKPEYIHFCSIISQMSTSQAEAFVKLIGVEKTSQLESGYDNIQMYYNQPSIASYLRKKIEESSAKDKGRLVDRLVRDIVINPGVMYIHSAVDFIGGEYVDYEYESGYEDDDETDYSILEALGLIRRVDSDFFPTKLGEMTIMFYHITQLGVRFATACELVK